MTQQAETAEQALLHHAERQTKALESINGALMFLLALAILGVLIAAASIWG